MMAIIRDPTDPFFQFCQFLPGVMGDIKWGNNLVCSVGGKIFVSFNFPEGVPFGFKVTPKNFQRLVELANIVPALYMAKYHWVSIKNRQVLPMGEILNLLREAHALTAARLSKKRQKELGLIG